MPKPRRPKALLGAHVSTAGGLDKAFSRAIELDAECLQIFTRAPSQWKAVEIPVAAIEAFREARKDYAGPVFAHDIYLTNLAAADETIRERSLASLSEEIRRCHSLGLDGLVCHLGSHPNTEVGLDMLSRGLNQVLEETRQCSLTLLLETTAGQGNTLGHRFEHLGHCIRTSPFPERLGVCLDTCHITAAGYDLRTLEAVEATLEEFSRAVGLDKLRLLHLNDSQKEMGSRVDRHANIGQGTIGKAGFRALLHHPGLAHLPMIIETPEMKTMHAADLAVLKKLRAGGAPRRHEARL